MSNVTYSSWFADGQSIGTLLEHRPLDACMLMARLASTPDVDTWIVNEATGAIIDVPGVDDREHCPHCDEPTDERDFASVPGCDDEVRWCYTCRHAESDREAEAQANYYGSMSSEEVAW